jgi:PEP-CTERM motif
MHPLASSLAALALGVALPAAAQASVIVTQPTEVTIIGAQPVSPAFDGWSVSGDASAPSDNILLLTTAFDASDDAGGSAVVGSGAIAAQQPRGVEELAGLNIGALDTNVDGVLHQALEGSVASRTVWVRAGDTLSFRWQLLSNEDPVAGLPDLAFATIGGRLFELGTPRIADLQGFGGFQHGSGWLTFTHTFADDAGPLALNNIELALGVVDRGDTSTSTALAIQGVTVTPVPEPATWGLGLSGILAAGAWGWRRRRAHH